MEGNDNGAKLLDWLEELQTSRWQGISCFIIWLTYWISRSYYSWSLSHCILTNIIIILDIEKAQKIAIYVLITTFATASLFYFCRFSKKVSIAIIIFWYQHQKSIIGHVENVFAGVCNNLWLFPDSILEGYLPFSSSNWSIWRNSRRKIGRRTCLKQLTSFWCFQQQ